MVKYQIVWRGYGVYKHPVKRPIGIKMQKELENRGEKLYSKEDADRIIKEHTKKKK